MQKQENILLGVLLGVGLIVVAIILVTDRQKMKQNDVEVKTSYREKEYEEKKELEDKEAIVENKIVVSEKESKNNSTSNSVIEEKIEDNEKSNVLNETEEEKNYYGENNIKQEEKSDKEEAVKQEESTPIIDNKEDVIEEKSEEAVLKDIPTKVESNNNSVDSTVDEEVEIKDTEINANVEDVVEESVVEAMTNNDVVVLSRMKQIEEDTFSLLNNTETDESVMDKAKGIFITLIDFVFYDAEIDGVTFNELTDAGKEKVLEIVTKIDSAIERKFPDYKENIAQGASKAFKKASELIKTGAVNINNFSREKLGEENYNSFIEAKDELVKYTKNAFNIVGHVGSELLKSAGSALQEWYENFREKNLN